MADETPWPNPPRLEEVQRKRGSSLALIQARLLRLKSFSSQTTLESPNDIRGPLGLNTLYEPSEPRVDFIFVHGLGGGSRKTWSNSDNKLTYWPKEWLPSEPGFEHVRINSYGYNSDWTTKQQSNLTLHDFGQALLADMYNSPQLRKPGNTPIVLIAHSMGGLVVKKAYLLATRDQMYRGIADRIHSMYFLASPHRGADSAKAITRLLLASPSHGSKAYVNELLPGSGTLQAINDEFRHVCLDLHLWSFFESATTTAGPVAVSIVDKESATIGLPGEHVQYLEADHRHICKFENPDHPNYIILLRCFMSTIQELDSIYTIKSLDQYKSHMKLISDLLGIQRRSDSDLLAITEKQHKGTCEWLTKSDIFQEWLDTDTTSELGQSGTKSSLNSRFLWLKGPPGSGKSVASGHVVRYLEACNSECSFHFFNHRNNDTLSLPKLLRSLAFQMAKSNLEIRQGLLEMAENEGHIQKDDHLVIWNMVFVNCIFQIESSQPHFWVIDALDECPTKSMIALVQMLSKMDPKTPLKILFTSRPNNQVENIFQQKGVPLLKLETGTEESLLDIASYVKAKWSYSEESATGENLLTEVLRKSNGIFLWASLIIGRLDEAYSMEDMEDILQQVPSEMNEFYTRITTAIAQSPSAELAKCILKWAICVPKPLTIEEMKDAIRMDINRTITASDDKLGHLCGNLIAVDKEGRLQVIHQTITAFLSQEASDFRVDLPSAHSRLAEICLERLNGKDFTPPRSRRVSSNRNVLAAFSGYACVYFSYHLAHSSSSNDAPLLLLTRFLNSNLLSWIEQVAATGSLAILTEAIQNLRVYLELKDDSRSPIGKEFQEVKAWIRDIARLVTNFGPNLLDSPSSIYFLVPSLCPPTSLLYRRFAKFSKQFRFMGSRPEGWDDRIACLLYTEIVMSVASNAYNVAAGLMHGNIMVYSNDTFELAATLPNGEAALHLSFGSVSGILASCGPRKVTLWSGRHEYLWSGRLESLPVALYLSPDDSEILIPKQDGSIAVFLSKSGERLKDLPLYHGPDSDSDEGDQVSYGTLPSIVRLSIPHKLAAVAYRNSPLTIWDLDRSSKVGVFEKKGCENVYNSPQIVDMVFNPVSELDLIAIAYDDGDIVTCDPWDLEQHSIYHLLAHSLAASPDGRILATGDTRGVIHLLLFRTLRLLYRIDAIGNILWNIIFASNSLRFFDIGGTHCNVWEPLILTQKDSSDDLSSELLCDEVMSTVPNTKPRRLVHTEEGISVIEHPPNADFVFCGRWNGSITVHELKSSNIVMYFQFHARMVGILHLKWNPEYSTLVSVDFSSRCIVSRLSVMPNGKWHLVQQPFNHRIDEAILQVLISPDALAVLIRTVNEAKLWALDGRLISVQKSSGKSTWITHPTDPKQVLCITGYILRVFQWDLLTKIGLYPDLRIMPSIELGRLMIPYKEVWLTRSGYSLIARITRLRGHETEFMILDSSNIDPNAVEVETTGIKKKLLARVRVVIGLSKSSLFFLDRKGWICSIDLKTSAAMDFYTRHFFIPLTWQTSPDLRLCITSRSTIAIAHEDQLMIFHGFLDFEEKVYFAEHYDGD
ncbi:hypothetical protein F5B20DRAFT_526327 [Whalleya microplaca]|nr:hypothetical protein F5B20DRAFT_526327 [Whalleya microplaca]